MSEKIERESKVLPKTPTLKNTDALGDEIAEKNKRLSPEDLDKVFISECNKHLKTMDIESGPKAFKFPYINIESGTVELANGTMESEKMTIGGHHYSIDAPGPIVLTRIEFPGGYEGITKMDGKILGLLPSPVSSKVKTSNLYLFLDELRQGLPKGTTKRLLTDYGEIDFKAL